jgi:hypothetical protein
VRGGHVGGPAEKVAFMTPTTATTGQFTATSDGARIDIEHRDGADVVLIDTLLVGPLSEPELSELLQTYVSDGLRRP